MIKGRLTGVGRVWQMGSPSGGAAVASKYPVVGKVVPYVLADVGAFCTQHHHVPTWGTPARDMLAQGKRPEAVVFELLKENTSPDLR